MKKRPNSTKTAAEAKPVQDVNDPRWMAAEIRRIDLRAFKSAASLLEIATDLLGVVDAGMTGPVLDMIYSARKELLRVERKRRDASAARKA